MTPTAPESHAYARFIRRVADGSQTMAELTFYMGWVALAAARLHPTPSQPPSPTQGASS